MNCDIVQYIGLPWEAGARGSEAFDCWGLVVYINEKYFGRKLPDIVTGSDIRALATAFQEHPERKRWQEIAHPSHGDAVLMRQARYPIHVGIWLDIDDGGVLHSVQENGVVFQNEVGLSSSGWRIEGFYHFNG